MKNKFYQLIGLIILTMLCINTMIHAEDTINISIDPDTNRVTVSGTLEQCSRKSVSVIEVKPNVTLSDLNSVSNENIMQYINNADATVTGETGDFSVSYINNGIDGEYTVRVISLDGKNVVEKSYSFYGNSMHDLKTNINSARTSESVDAMNAILQDTYTSLNISNEVFENALANSVIKEKYSKFVAELLLDYPEVENISEVIPQFEEAAMIARTNVFSDENDFKSFVESYGDTLGIKESTAYITYANSAAKSKIIDAIIPKNGVINYNCQEDFLAAFEKNTILVSVEKSNGWGSVRDVLNTNSALIIDANGNSIDLQRCELLNGYEDIYKGLEGKKFTSLNALKTEFDRLVSEKETSAPVSSPSYSSGTGSKYTPFTTAPDVQVPGTTQQNGVFSDTAKYSWAEESIMNLYKKNIVVGSGENKFEPERSVTRSEFVKMLILALNMYNPDAHTNFSDIKENDWQYVYISSAYDLGIIALDESRIFGANNVLSREDMAAMCYRAMKVMNLVGSDLEEPTGFEDEGVIAEYAISSVSYLKKIGVINGMTNEIFSPKTNVNRAQAAVIIDKLMNVTGGVR